MIGKVDSYSVVCTNSVTISLGKLIIEYFLQIRNFMTSMREHLLEHHKSDLVACGMESCDNFEHVVETTLQLCILRPLSHYVYLRIEEYYTSNGFLFQVQRSIQQGKLKKQEDFGIRVSVY